MTFNFDRGIKRRRIEHVTNRFTLDKGQVNELIERWNKLAAVDEVILFVELICVLRTPIQVVCIRKLIRFSARLHIS